MDPFILVIAERQERVAHVVAHALAVFLLHLPLLGLLLPAVIVPALLGERRPCGQGQQ